ncbi:squalene synthase HpnD [Pararobbsia silviterrae]|uniref:Squalene synthase HpnD n=2 Tax=Pararobbsia silviterrae TaxID=1792498 RepID=A0A494XEU6_9BURK|nr:presqualene diphosphate synthase HpnD [Pararobbsia silviterrae]RKP46679.1 squalene synthase HpnD [Pararobbsia silviterrae]
MSNPSPETSSERVAAGSSFYAAMRILPPAQRDGMFEIYSFCRQVDDIADAEGPRDGRQAALEQWRRDLDDVYAGLPPERLRPLARTITTFALDKADFLAVVDGMEMDVVSTIVAPDLATLDLYCDRVASAVGRLCVRIFGMAHDDGIALSHHLGRALQLTNILRDIDEDADIGRVYLPRESLLAAGVTTLTPEAVRASRLDLACAPLIAQAKEHFAVSTTIMKRYPRGVVIAPKIMAEAYGAILDKLIARGFDTPRARVRVSKLRLIALLIKNKYF